ncbi:MAG TPA: restriction endonuclease [Myxococcaceae bacterium]|nr:restriction endonuclease [Myxococcaceae bacterium]
MNIVIIGVVALILGFVVIVLISLTSPRQGEAAPGGANGSGEPTTSHGWIARLDARDLGKLLTMLFSELKFEVEDSRVSDGVVDLFAVNPTPITGGRIYIRGVSHPPLGVVGEEEVRVALDTARAEMAGKALVATGGVFSPEAKAAAEGAPLELLDGPALMALIKKHLPPIAVARRV